MNSNDTIDTYLSNPFPVWQSHVAGELRFAKLASMIKEGQIREESNYSTANVWIPISNEILDSQVKSAFRGKISLEHYYDGLSSFFDEHGLRPLHFTNDDISKIIHKLSDSFDFLEKVPECLSTVIELISSINIVVSDDPEIDVSYSHPKIPFTIFVSLCKFETPIENLRVAESILHEAMHLKLTLIEGRYPLIDFSKGNLYFSPWRQEMRPPQGVMHGVFVFSAIKQFYERLLLTEGDAQLVDYIQWRIEQITTELSMVTEFRNAVDLTKGGANLLANLLPSN